MYSLIQTVAPTVEPVTAAEVKANSRIDGDQESTLIDGLITAAREWVESRIGQQLITATWRLTLDGFPCGTIQLPRPPLVSVTSIQYVDPAGTTQTWSSSKYDVDSYSRPGRVMPAFGEVYPVTRGTMNCVTITYQAGYGTAAASVPQVVRQAILLLVGHWYENRESTTEMELRSIPMGVESLLMSQWHGSCALAGVSP